MANTINFTGRIVRRKENAFVEKNFSSGWVINELNFSMVCGDNVQYLRAQGGMWDEKHANKNSVMTYKYNENGKDEPITVKWDDRFNPEIVETIANYRTYTVDTEIKADREAAEQSGDATAIANSKKKHKTFITAIDFVKWLNTVTSNEKTKDWIWNVTGEVEYSYSNGNWYRNFVPRRVYHVADTTEQKSVGTIKTFYTADCMDDMGEDDVIFNVYTQYYDQQCKKNCFMPMPIVISKSHEKAKGLIRQYSKAEDDAVRELSINVDYINGAQRVAISEEHLSDEQREMIEDGLVTLEQIQRELGGSVYGEKKTEIRATGLARGYATSGSKETVFTQEDLMSLPHKEEEEIDIFANTDDDEI